MIENDPNKSTTHTEKTFLFANHEQTDVEKKLRYPRSVFYIIVNEFCERFSYYGMKTVLSIYLRDILLYTENDATLWYHAFSMLCYFTPVFGAILADNYLGKFKTILFLSIFYACGNILLSVASIPKSYTGIPQNEISLLGLFIIGVGTGGIKPCVSAFGGDQFVRPQQDLQLEQFFSIFYFAINAGSLISTFLTPVLRKNVHCFGDESCFPLAFGVPAVLMVFAIIVFVIGKRKYKIRPAEGNVIVDFAKCVVHAVGRKIKNKGEERCDHWLDFASDKYDKQLIDDIKQVFRVFVLYIPIPVFWALFDQQGSRWTFQATRMDGSLGSFTLLPDQMGIVNPLLILALVPVFESLIYPAFTKCGLLTPLQRIGTGGIITALAFVVSGFLELGLRPTYEKIPGEGLTQFNFINTLPCHVNISYTQYHPNQEQQQSTKWIEMAAHGYTFERDLKADKPIPVRAHLLNTHLCGNLNLTSTEWAGDIQGASTKAFAVVITTRGGRLELVRINKEEPLHKSKSGDPVLRFVVNLNDEIFDQGDVSIKLKDDVKEKPHDFFFSTANTSFTSTSGRLVSTMEKDISAGTYDVYIPHHDGKANTDEPAGTSIALRQGGCYTVFIQRQVSPSNHEVDLVTLIEVTPPNSLHLMWQIPQIFLITVAEVMFSVTGLQFSFTQAPASMKSVMQATWLLTVAFGNLIVMVVAKTSVLAQAEEFFLFAGLMGLDMILFIYLATRYTYVEEGKTNEKPAVTEEKGKDNKAFNDTSI